MREVSLIDQWPIVETGLRSLWLIVEHVNALECLKPSLEQAPGPPYMLITNGEIPSRIEKICSLQAIAYACLFDAGNRHREPAKHTKLRKERINSVKQRCDSMDTPQLRNKGVRNALAHFDERMLKAIVEDKNFNVVQDVAVSHAAALDFGEAQPLYIRYYCFDLDTVFLFDEKLHPSALKAECKAVLEKWPEWSPDLSQ